RIGLLGLSFKSETDDLRESPLVILAEQLIGKGYRIKVYDENVSLARLIGANREFIEREIPHIAELMTDKITELLQFAEIIVVGNKNPKFREIIKQATEEQIVIDLVRIINTPAEIVAQYEGICW
ncbi:MAG: UDP binding domain-containing protein, partial [Candidatus Sumerlaeia bacterium]|nr:UDP binding domain-containing protein [Candidatus Sumerlaeia bacterium]